MARTKKTKETPEQTTPTPSEETHMPATSSVLTSPFADGMEAFYAGNYERAVACFETVLQDPSLGDDAKVKAAYWRAESLLQREFTQDKIALFERVAEEYPNHYLAAAAQRRCEALKNYFAAFTSE
jgi:TolA-binding protein